MNIKIQWTLSELVRLNIDSDTLPPPDKVTINIGDLTKQQRKALAGILADYSDRIPLDQIYDPVSKSISLDYLKANLK